MTKAILQCVAVVGICIVFAWGAALVIFWSIETMPALLAAVVSSTALFIALCLSVLSTFLIFGEE